MPLVGIVQCGSNARGAGARGDGERRVVLAGHRNSRRRRDALRNLPLVLRALPGAGRLWPVRFARLNGKKKDSGNHAGEDADDQAELITEPADRGLRSRGEVWTFHGPEDSVPNRHAACVSVSVHLVHREPMNIVTGLFRDRDSAERAYQSVVERGYDTSDINLVMSDETRNRYFSGAGQIDTDLGSKAAERPEDQAAATIGGPLGGTLGTIAAALAALGTVTVLPGLGIVVAGPVAAALAAAGSVGIAGGLIGALTAGGYLNERVEHYEAGIRDGGVLMGVTPRSDEDAFTSSGSGKQAAEPTC